MKIYASSRLLAKPLLAKPALNLPDDEFQNLMLGVRSIRKWYQMATITSNKAINPLNQISPQAFKAMKDAMMWIRDNLFPDIAQGFSEVYRVQVLPEAEVGKSVTVEPKLSVLSWTDHKEPKVIKRKKTEDDAIVSIKAKDADVIWSFKILEHLKDLKKLEGDPNRQLSELARSLVYLLTSQKAYITKEREILIENRRKPFKVKVLRKGKP